jgi:hypothetical protein
MVCAPAQPPENAMKIVTAVRRVGLTPNLLLKLAQTMRNPRIMKVSNATKITVQPERQPV